MAGAQLGNTLSDPQNSPARVYFIDEEAAVGEDTGPAEVPGLATAGAWAGAGT